MDGLLPILAQTTEELTTAEAIGILTIMMAILIAGFLFYIIPMFFIYKKAGKPAWAAIVPFYNVWVHGQIIGRNPLLILLLPLVLFVLGFVPIVGWLTWAISPLVGAIIAYDTALVFGQSQGLAIANIFFSPFINFYLAFSNNAQYQGPLAAADQRILMEAPWLDPDLGVQGINPYAPQVYSATGHYDPNAASTYQPMGYNPTGAPMPGQPPMGAQPGMPAQPPFAGQPGMPPQPGAPAYTPQPGMPTMPPAQPPATGNGNVSTSAADWGPAPETFSQPPAAPAPEAPPAAPNSDGDTPNPFENQ